jgi:hypothetical protein
MLFCVLGFAKDARCGLLLLFGAWFQVLTCDVLVVGIWLGDWTFRHNILLILFTDA